MSYRIVIKRHLTSSWRGAQLDGVALPGGSSEISRRLRAEVGLKQRMAADLREVIPNRRVGLGKSTKTLAPQNDRAPDFTVIAFNTAAAATNPIVPFRSPEMGLQPDLATYSIEPPR